MSLTLSWPTSSSSLYEPGLPTVDDNERIYAIGDIHGRFDLLIRMLCGILKDASRHGDGRRPRIVFLGDYIDRGDNSRSVLDFLERLTRDNPRNIILLRGNHEDALRSFLIDPEKGRDWLAWGAAQTLASYGLPPPPSDPDERALTAMRDKLATAMGRHVELLERLVPSFRSGDVCFTHAGIDPTDTADPHAMIWGTPGFLCDWPAVGSMVVHGHYDDREPSSAPGRLCVDTGAYYSGRLTAARLDASVGFVSVSAAGPEQGDQSRVLARLKEMKGNGAARETRRASHTRRRSILR